MPSTIRLSAIVLCLTGWVGSAPAQEAFSVGLWGDMPYARNNDAVAIPALVADMNAADLAFTIYVGDIKDGSSECTDAVYADAAAMFGTLTAPAFYVPGDNEWTDCHRKNNGGYDPLARLDHIRKTLFAQPDSFGATKLRPEHQGKPGEAYAENLRFSRAGAMFVTLNIPGSNNGKVNSDESCLNRSARTLEQCAAGNAEWAARDAANIAWLKAAFAAAKSAGDKGVMIAIQGDPGFDVPETEDADESRLPKNDGYAAFLDALMAETQAYGGEVVLVHGDTHYFKIDKPLPSYNDTIPNFTRVQTFGSPNLHWVRVDVDASRRDIFAFRPMIVTANVGRKTTTN